ncbi:Hypothetical protein FKW44_010097, partial [Caligus rogercresseyi]
SKRHEVAFSSAPATAQRHRHTHQRVSQDRLQRAQAHQRRQDLKDKPRCGRPVKLSTEVVQKAFTANPKLAMATWPGRRT